MANKVVFIRRSHEDLLVEQNKLLLELLSRQPEQVQVKVEQPLESSVTSEKVEETPSPDFSFDEPAFVPTVKTEGTADLSRGVEETSAEIDHESVGKLRGKKNA